MASSQFDFAPGDFAFMRDEYWRRCLKKSYDHVTELNLWEFLKVQNPPFGKKYVSWQESNMYSLKKMLEHDLKNFIVDFEMLMRTMEYIAKYGWDQYMERMSYHN